MGHLTKKKKKKNKKLILKKQKKERRRNKRKLKKQKRKEMIFPEVQFRNKNRERWERCRASRHRALRRRLRRWQNSTTDYEATAGACERRRHLPTAVASAAESGRWCRRPCCWGDTSRRAPSLRRWWCRRPAAEVMPHEELPLCDSDGGFNGGRLGRVLGATMMDLRWLVVTVYGSGYYVFWFWCNGVFWVLMVFVWVRGWGCVCVLWWLENEGGGFVVFFGFFGCLLCWKNRENWCKMIKKVQDSVVNRCKRTNDSVRVLNENVSMQDDTINEW